MSIPSVANVSQSTPLAWLGFSRILGRPQPPVVGLPESGPPPATLSQLSPVSGQAAIDGARRTLELQPLGTIVVVIEVPGRRYVPYQVHDGSPGVSVSTLEQRVEGALKALGPGARVFGKFQSVKTPEGVQALYTTGRDPNGYLLPLDLLQRHPI